MVFPCETSFQIFTQTKKPLLQVFWFESIYFFDKFHHFSGFCNWIFFQVFIEHEVTRKLAVKNGVKKKFPLMSFCIVCKTYKLKNIYFSFTYLMHSLPTAYSFTKQINSVEKQNIKILTNLIALTG